MNFWSRDILEMLLQLQRVSIWSVLFKPPRSWWFPTWTPSFSPVSSTVTERIINIWLCSRCAGSITSSLWIMHLFFKIILRTLQQLAQEHKYLRYNLGNSQMTVFISQTRKWKHELTMCYQLRCFLTFAGSESTAYASPIILNNLSVSLRTSSPISFHNLSSLLSFLVNDWPAFNKF